MQQYNVPQLQMMVCGYATEQQVQNWQVAPGYLLIFLDPNGKALRTKSMAYGSYMPEIKKYYLDEPVQTQEATNESTSDVDILKSEIQSLKDMVNNLNEKVNNKPYYKQKKEGGNNVQ